MASRLLGVLFTHADGSRGVRFLPPFVCVSVCFFPHDISQTPMKTGLPNLTQKYSKTSSGNPFILRSKGQRSRSRVTKALPAWVFVLL